MSPENQGVFQPMKKETQLAIAREDWNTDGSLVMHQNQSPFILDGRVGVLV